MAWPRWTLATGASVAVEERLPWPTTLLMGAQHVVAMSGSTILGPLLMGFDPSIAVFFSGLGTLLFFCVTTGRLPSYLGSSFSFIATVTALTGYSGHGANPDPALALGGIVVAGAVYALVGLVVIAIGSGWVQRFLPPVVTGAVGMAIGLNLAPIATRGIEGSAATLMFGCVTILLVSLVAVYAPRPLRRVAILAGTCVAYGFYVACANGLRLGVPVDFSSVRHAAWFGVPSFRAPRFTWRAAIPMAPIAIVLVAENLGHIKAIGAMTGRNLDSLIGRAFLGDGLATMLAGAGGGTGVTTYVENMGVMAISRVFSTLIFACAGVFAVLLGLSPKFGAVLQTIPEPVLGGLAIVVFGLIAATMVRVWTEHDVDLSDPANLIIIGVTVVAGAGDLTLHIGQVSIGGIGMATLAAVLLNQLLRRGSVTRS